MLSNVVWSCRLTVNEDVFLDDLQCPIAIMQCLPCTCFIFYTTSRLLMQLAHGRDFRKLGLIAPGNYTCYDLERNCSLLTNEFFTRV